MQGGVAGGLGRSSPRPERVSDEPPSEADLLARSSVAADGPRSAVAEDRTGTRPNPRRRTSIYIGVAVATLVIVVVLVYSVFGVPHSSSNSGVLLVPAGTGLSLPAGQFSGFEFTTTTASVITGSLNSSEGVQIYVMTSQEFHEYIKTSNITGYAWTSGWVANETIYNLDAPVSPGQWFLVLTDPNPGIPTGIGIYTDIVVKST